MTRPSGSLPDADSIPRTLGDALVVELLDDLQRLQAQLDTLPERTRTSADASIDRLEQVAATLADVAWEIREAAVQLERARSAADPEKAKLNGPPASASRTEATRSIPVQIIHDRPRPRGLNLAEAVAAASVTFAAGMLVASGLGLRLPAIGW